MAHSTDSFTKLCIRLSLHVCVFLRTKQAVSRRYERPRPDDRLDPANGRTSCCSIALCLLPKQQRPRRKLHVCRINRPSVRWPVHRRTTPKKHMETRPKIDLFYSFL